MEAGRVKERLIQLQELSKDPEYDRYLAQMMRDLESGRATPDQVAQEAERSYGIYEQRMRTVQTPSGQKEALRPEDEVEVKVGIHLFGMIGAVFVLVAFIIFGFNFLGSLWQGICLYLAAVVLLILPEIFLYRKFPVFAQVITGIGVGGIYIANMVNYRVLHNLNEVGVLALTLAIALGTAFYMRKRESTAIRLLGLLGYYLCLLLTRGFETELVFLLFTFTLFVINFVWIGFRGRKKQTAADIVHLTANLFFTVIVTQLASEKGIGSIYLALFVITAFIIADLMAYIQCREKGETLFFPFICIENGLLLLLLCLVGYGRKGMGTSAHALFVHLISETLVIFTCALFFLLWDKEDKRKWAQLYYGAGAVLLLCSFSEYHLETMIGQLIVLFIIKLANRHKETAVLECIAVTWAGVTGLWLSDYWYCWVFAGALAVGVLWLRHFSVYQEIVTVASVLLIWWSQCKFYLDGFGLGFKWFYPVSAGVLLVFFLLFNHAPWMKGTNQTSYNIISAAAMGGLYLIALFGHDVALGLTMMALGGLTIAIIFGKRYGMYFPRRYLLLAGFLWAYALICCVDSPVLVSILLMVTALGCVGIGFRQADKAARVCGLAMAVFVCLKLVLLDFAGVRAFHKMIVFLVVGILALVISFLYIVLDRSLSGTGQTFIKPDRKQASRKGSLFDKNDPDIKSP